MRPVGLKSCSQQGRSFPVCKKTTRQYLLPSRNARRGHPQVSSTCWRRRPGATCRSNSQFCRPQRPRRRNCNERQFISNQLAQIISSSQVVEFKFKFKLDVLVSSPESEHRNCLQLMPNYLSGPSNLMSIYPLRVEGSSRQPASQVDAHRPAPTDSPEMIEQSGDDVHTDRINTTTKTTTTLTAIILLLSTRKAPEYNVHWTGQSFSWPPDEENNKRKLPARREQEERQVLCFSG